MSVNDAESFSARKYLKLQTVLQAIETQKMAIGSLVAMTGCLDPHFTVKGRLSGQQFSIKNSIDRSLSCTPLRT